ncbi:1-phosphofructokinase family hexose kinase [Cnuibacter sp. UC19_7]|uniref:1-phosphofructokinase family hexose kinase n=1 Tax=Cnuibacter sp. UC19_7 TaxID=3350166 RepID=UPI00366E494F
MITCLGLAPALDITYGLPSARLGAIHRPDWQLSLPGGKSLNVARALALLGAEACAIVPVGGATGEELVASLGFLGEDGRTRIDVIETGVPTRRCITIVDGGAGELTEIYENAPPIPDDAWDEIVARVATVTEGWLAVSGSVPEHRISSLAAQLALATERGVQVALDVRQDVLDAVFAVCRPALVKVNRSEAADAVGTGSTPELAHRLRVRGAGIAVVTDGADGSVGEDDRGVWRVRAPRGGIFTVGAGDSFLAGLLHRLSAGAPLDTALRTASAVAGANTHEPGAAVFDPARAALAESAVSVIPEGA